MGMYTNPLAIDPHSLCMYVCMSRTRLLTACLADAVQSMFSRSSDAYFRSNDDYSATELLPCNAFFFFTAGVTPHVEF